MYWTADALLNFYKATGEEKYLKTGQRVVDQNVDVSIHLAASVYPDPRSWRVRCYERRR